MIATNLVAHGARSFLLTNLCDVEMAEVFIPRKLPPPFTGSESRCLAGLDDFNELFVSHNLAIGVRGVAFLVSTDDENF